VKVISITETGKRKKAVLILMDDEQEIRVDAGFVSKHSLVEGMEIGDGVWDAWLAEWQRRKAMDAALTYLGYRSRSRAEMDTYLKDKGYPPAVTAYVIEKLTGYGYLDDRRYAVDLLNACRSGKPMGRMRIKAKLKERGIGDDLIEETLAAYDEEEELAQAVACLKKQLARRKGKTPEIQKRQSYAALARRGFNWEIIQRAWGCLDADTKDGT
jgi:regulatory protein